MNWLKWFLLTVELKWILGAGVFKIDEGKAHYENLEGEYKEEDFDFAMLIPSFSGHGFKAFDKNENDITDKLFKGFMIVDADYTSKPYEEWTVQDWPETYQNPNYANIFAPGIAFAPPHSISKPRKSKMVRIFSFTSKNWNAFRYYSKTSCR